MSFEPRRKKVSWSLLFPIIIILLIKTVSLSHTLVENAYSGIFFPGFAFLLRKITGWIPFSLGDIIYFLAGGWLVWKSIKFIVMLYKKQIDQKTLVFALKKIFLIGAWVYIIFNIFWGLNYNRKGIAYQLHFSSTKYDSTDLKKIVTLLLQKTNASKQALINHQTPYPDNSGLFERAGICYNESKKFYEFLDYMPVSLKSSMYSWFGSYLGFTGYYNPFSGEAQVNTLVPKFILPYTTCHEMAHQLGYAKEDEANFVGYLAATSSSDTLFHYSTYLDLFLYANRDLSITDPFFALAAVQKLSPAVKADLKEWSNFLKVHKSMMEPLVRWTYTKYLKANQQPKGLQTYSEVVANLIAFYKKYGRI